MSRISGMFAAKKDAEETALIEFITAGDPTLETTREVLAGLVRGGVDLIELGIPYSDPMADGPVIQRTSERALLQGISIADVLNLVKEFRTEHDTPIILFGYYNPFFQYGLEALAKDAAEAGVDGFLVVDLPPEEAGPLHRSLKQFDLDLIALLTPTSDEKRIQSIQAIASGFVYYVSVKGVTGARQAHAYDTLGPRVRHLQEALQLPVAVGFGISTPEQAGEVGAFADGAVIGSALIQAMEPHLSDPKKSSEVAEMFTKNIVSGLR